MTVPSGFRLALILCLFGLPAAQACGDAAPAGDARRTGGADGAAGSEDRTVVPVVAVPVAPMAGLVEAVAPPGGVDVVVLVPSGANPATYEPGLEALQRTAGARLYFGLEHPAFVFERAWLSGLLDGSDAERVPLFSDCPAVEDDYHVWLSASCVGEAARRAAVALRRIAPESGAEIDERLEAFLARIAATDSLTRVRLEGHRGEMFVVLHPAWGYLARPYGLSQLSILTHGTGDPGPGRLGELIGRARRSGTTRVFIQPQFNRAPARLVAEEIGARLVLLDPLRRDPLAAIDEATEALAADFAARREVEGKR